MNFQPPRLSETQTRLGGYGSSSIGRVAVSKTVGWGFDSLLPCQPSLGADAEDDGCRAGATAKADGAGNDKAPSCRSGARPGQKARAGRRATDVKNFRAAARQPVCDRRGGRVVYRGGLENRFGLTPDGGSNPSLSASLRSERNGERRLPRRSAKRAGGPEW
jgi:hypothetical protein